MDGWRKGWMPLMFQEKTRSVSGFSGVVGREGSEGAS